MNKTIFREYDIRGVVDRDLTTEVVENLGKAFGTIIRRGGGKTISIGYDARSSSPRFFDLLSKGVRSTGINVIGIGLVPTPLLYFSLHHLDVDGGVMITGSHNPPEFNGFKMSQGTGSVYGKQIQLLCRMMEDGDFETGDGHLAEQDVIADYNEMVRSKIRLKRPVKIVIDSGNGCGGIMAPALIRSLGAEVEELYCEVDGSFPNHHPDPTVPANLTDLIAKVKETGADVGIAYDGDADRIGIVDEKGGVIYGDMILLIFARDILAHKPGAKIVFDVKCSQTLIDDICNRGGIPLINATGHSLIKERLKHEGAELAGEMSAHIFFSDDYFGYDDAIYATARFLRIMSETDQPVSEFLADTPTVYNTPEIRIDCADEVKFALIDDMVADFKAEGCDVLDLDGARVSFEGGWGLVRASNTQPCLVLRFEAESEARLSELKQLFRKKLLRHDSITTLESF